MRTSLWFTDQHGNRFPEQSPGLQHVTQFSRGFSLPQIRLRSDQDIPGAMAWIEGSPNERLEQTGPREWVRGESVREPTSRREKRTVREIASTAGIVEAKVKVNGMVYAVARLQIAPANLTEQQLSTMLQEIGVLAFSSGQRTWSEVETIVGEELGLSTVGISRSVGGDLFATASELIKLSRAISSALPTIERRPLKTLKPNRSSVPANKIVRTPRAMISRALHPGRMRLVDLARIETADCSENHFVRFLIEKIVVEFGESLIKTIQENLSSFSEFKRACFLEFGVPNSADAFERIADAAILELKKAGDDLRRRLGESRVLRHDYRGAIPRPTLRLRRSSGYAQVWRASCRFLRSGIGDVAKVAGLLKAATSKEVLPTWECYEIWCFVQIYSMFTNVAGFTVPKGGATLVDQLAVTAHGIRLQSIPEGLPLERIVADDRHPTFVKLFYEKKVPAGKSELRPDIWCQIESGGRTTEIAFDAKYRDYSAQSANELVNDVWGVAKQKYLTRPDSPPRACFILHCSPASGNQTFDYWGEMPLAALVRQIDRRVVPPDGAEAWPDHEYGAIRLAPSHWTNLQKEKLLCLLFLHTSKNGTSCPKCGGNVSFEPNEGGGAGTRCQCVKCGCLWGTNHCLRCKRPIFKFGKQSFHHQSAHPGQDGIYVCPSCGCDPKFSTRSPADSSPQIPPWTKLGQDDEDIPF